MLRGSTATHLLPVPEPRSHPFISQKQKLVSKEAEAQWLGVAWCRTTAPNEGGDDQTNCRPSTSEGIRIQTQPQGHSETLPDAFTDVHMPPSSCITTTALLPACCLATPLTRPNKTL